MKLYVIQETDEGEAECRGNEYSNLIVFEESAINKLAHQYMMDNKIAEKIAEEDNCSVEECLPENGQWDFFDFMEEMEHSGEYKRNENYHINYEMALSFFNLDNKNHLDSFYKTLKHHKEADGNFSLGIEREVLYKALGEKNINEINIVDKCAFELVESIIIKVDDEDVGNLTESKTIKMSSF